MIALQVIVTLFVIAGTLGGCLYLAGVLTGAAAGMGSTVAAAVQRRKGVTRGRHSDADTEPKPLPL